MGYPSAYQAIRYHGQSAYDRHRHQRAELLALVPQLEDAVEERAVNIRWSLAEALHWDLSQRYSNASVHDNTDFWHSKVELRRACGIALGHASHRAEARLSPAAILQTCQLEAARDFAALQPSSEWHSWTPEREVAQVLWFAEASTTQMLTLTNALRDVNLDSDFLALQFFACSNFLDVKPFNVECFSDHSDVESLVAPVFDPNLHILASCEFLALTGYRFERISIEPSSLGPAEVVVTTYTTRNLRERRALLFYAKRSAPDLAYPDVKAVDFDVLFNEIIRANGVTINAPPARRVGGPGDCWRCLPVFQSPSDWEMTTVELVERIVSYVNLCGDQLSDYVVIWSRQVDLDFHVTACTAAMESYFGCPCLQEGLPGHARGECPFVGLDDFVRALCDCEPGEIFLVGHESERAYVTSVAADPIGALALSAKGLRAGITALVGHVAAEIPEQPVHALSVDPLPIGAPPVDVSHPPWSIDFSLLPDWLPFHPELASVFEYLSRVLPSLASQATGLAFELGNIAAHIASGALWAHSLLRIFFVLNQHHDDRHDNRTKFIAIPRVIDHIDDVVFEDAALRVALNAPMVPRGRDRIGLTSWHITAQKLLRVEEQGRVNGAIANSAVAIAERNLNFEDAPYLHLPSNVSESVFRQFGDAFPALAVTRARFTHPHGAAASARFAMHALISAKLARNCAPVFGVGLSPVQVSRINDVVHNVAPILSGRDYFRHDLSPSQVVRDFANVVRCPSKLEDCRHGFDKVPTFVAMFSTHDIAFSDFVSAMASRGSHTAYVAMHLPVPLLDQRLDEYYDDCLDMHYQVIDGSVQVTFGGGLSAGYVHDMSKLITWLMPRAILPGYHVQVEELSHVGSCFLLEINVSPGFQEATPTSWCLGEPFLLLPTLRSSFARTDNDHFFTVPMRRWRALVSFAATLRYEDLTFQIMAQKLRGLLGEVRIGEQVIEERWDVDTTQFYSLVAHALIHHSRASFDYDNCMRQLVTFERERRARQGNFTQRAFQYVADVFSGQINRKYGPLDKRTRAKLYDFLFMTHADSDTDYDPYTPRHRWDISTANLRPLPAELCAKFTVKSAQAAANGGLQLANVVVPAASNLCNTVANAVSGALNDVVESLAHVCDPPPVINLAPHLPPQLVPTPWGRERDDIGDLVERYTLNFDEPDSDLIYCVPPPPRDHARELALTLRYFEIDDFNQPPIPVAPFFNYHFPRLGAQHDAAAEVALAVLEDELEYVDFGVLLAAPHVQAADHVQAFAQVEHDADQAGAPSDASSIHTVAALSDAPSRAATPPPIVEPPPAVPAYANVRPPFFNVDVAPACSLLNIAVPDNLVTDVPLNFEGDCWPPIAVRTRGADAFYDQFPNEEAFRAAHDQGGGQFLTCLPDSGLFQLLDIVLYPTVTRSIPRPAFFNVPQGDDSLSKHLRAFFGSRFVQGPARRPQLVLSGVASSAKSTLLRRYIVQRDLQNVLVVVPSNALAAEWRELADERFTVITQHCVPYTTRHRLIVVDEAFTMDLQTLLAWCCTARCFGAKIVLLGDHTQRVSQDGLPHVTHDIFVSRRFHMPVANTVPHDAFTIYHGLLPFDAFRDFAQTRSPRPRSIVFVPRADCAGAFPLADMYLKAHLHAALNFRGHDAITIGSSQGMRAASVVLAGDVSNPQAMWYFNHPGARIVALTRATTVTFVFGDQVLRDAFVGGGDWDHIPYVGALAARDIKPFCLDELVVPQVMSDEMRSRTTLSSFGYLDVSDSLMTRNVVSDAHLPEHPASVLPVMPAELQSLIFSKTNFSTAKEAGELIPFQIARPVRLRKVGEIGPLVMRTDVLSNFHEGYKMGDVQVSSSQFESLRNFALRNLEPVHPFGISINDATNASILVERFSRTFLSKNTTLNLEGDFAKYWFSRRSPAIFQRAEEFFGETSRSVTFSSFLKTQVKVKPAAGFAAGVNYGQQIVSHDLGYALRMAASQSIAFARAGKLLRDGVIFDIGYSDNELARKLRSLAPDFEKQNTQIDLSRQDSSHDAVQVLCFAWFLSMAGVDDETISLYVAMRSRYGVKSQEPHLFRGEIAWSLPSGDPFTLLANCVMTAFSILGRYSERELSKCVYLQKGDDALLNCRLELLPEPLRLARNVKFKVAFDTLPYHAGRFWLVDHFVADPIRVFCRHFARLADPNVTVSELHQSFVSRSVTLSHSDERIVSCALLAMYDGWSNEDVDVALRCLVSLTNYDFFSSTCLHVTNQRRIYNMPLDCAFRFARDVLKLDSKNARLFRTLGHEQIAKILRDNNFVVHVVGDFAGQIIDHPCVLLTETHIMLVLNLDGSLPYESSNELKSSIVKSCLLPLTQSASLPVTSASKSSARILTPCLTTSPDMGRLLSNRSKRAELSFRQRERSSSWVAGRKISPAMRTLTRPSASPTGDLPLAIKTAQPPSSSILTSQDSLLTCMTTGDTQNPWLSMHTTTATSRATPRSRISSSTSNTTSRGSGAMLRSPNFFGVLDFGL
jgi:hypothetical protein